MTSLPNRTRSTPNRPRADIANSLKAGAALALVGVLGAVGMSGCSDDDKPVAVVEAPPPPPPPPAAPAVTPIADLMAKHNIDDRVRLSEELAPDNDAARVAVLRFFDAFVRGDASTLSNMLSAPDRLELEKLQKEGRWSPVIESIKRVDVRTGPNPKSSEKPPCALAVFYTGTQFQPQLWSYELGAATEFVAEPSPPSIMEKLSGQDWIAAWFKVLEDEFAKAEVPDENIIVKSVNHDENADAEPEAPNDNTSGNPVRRGPGGVPGRRKPSEPIEPPKLSPSGN